MREFVLCQRTSAQDVRLMIGLSLSFCIKDIMAGNVAEGDVTKIVTMTRAVTEADWKALIAGYQNIYWRPFQCDTVAELIQRLRAQGKIEQPRVNDPDHEHYIGQGHWIPDEAA
jgi:hypothetical protein